jgi:uncharacterized protein (TIGR02271 family)
MAVNDLVRSQDAANSRVIAFFKNSSDAYKAISELKNAGFTENEIGIMHAGGADVSGTDVSANQQSSGEREGFWQKVKDFFSGESHDDVNYRDSISDMDWDENRADYYRSGLASGGVLVSVAGTRNQEARRILQQAGGETRDSGFESYRNQEQRTDSRDTDRDYRIQLRGEVLRAYKDRVQRGEVRVRKDVITENQNIEVPVTREELVVERVPASGAQVTGEIGSDNEIRVPLSEERARVEKQPVVNEEVRVGKRAVQNTQQVSDQVRHEELRVDKEGDVDVNRRKDLKKPA